MELQRKIRSIANKIGPSPGKPPPQQTNPNQGLATLIVMIVVLTIIILFCCFAAPGVRDLCKRYIFRSCQVDDPDRDNVFTRRYYTRNDFEIISEAEKRRDKEILRESQRQR